MAKFCLRLDKPDGTFDFIFYDNETSEVRDAHGALINFDSPLGALKHCWKTPDQTLHACSEATPTGKRRLGIKSVKLQLGMKCNYSCSYCLQNRDSEAPGGVPDDVEPLVNNFKSWLSDSDGDGVTFEIRGGEPLVYWKTLKPLIEQTRAIYPKAVLLITTNGALLDVDKAQFLIAHDVIVVVSHDGPGQHVRGEDPLRDPTARAGIDFLHKNHNGKFLFAAMLNQNNLSRAAIAHHLINEMQDTGIPITEGFFVDVYDPNETDIALSGEAAIKYRAEALNELNDDDVLRTFQNVQSTLRDFMESLSQRRPLDVVGQRCGLDLPERIAVDMKGNVLTCQNVTADEKNHAGLSHKIGHVSDIDSVRLNTATHWMHREGCRTCPVVHLCRGSCMYAEGEAFAANCASSYNDKIVLFVAAFQSLLGGTVTYIDNPDLAADRKDIFGLHGGALPRAQKPPKKTIKIALAT